METKGKYLLKHLIKEGLLGAQGQPMALPKVDGGMQQNTAVPKQGTAQTPNPEPQQQNSQTPNQNPNQKPTNDKQNESSDQYMNEMEAGVYGLHLAEMHMNRLGEMKNEAEDVETDKLDGMRKVITDTRSQLREMYDRLKENRPQQA